MNVQGSLSSRASTAPEVSAFQENSLGKLDVGVRGHRLCKNLAPSEGPTAPWD